MEQGDTEIKVQGLQAEVTPYDHMITPPAGGICPGYGQDYTHAATLTFAEKGTDTIVFRGRNQLPSATVPVAVARTVEVR